MGGMLFFKASAKRGKRAVWRVEYGLEKASDREIWKTKALFRDVKREMTDNNIRSVQCYGIIIKCVECFLTLTP